MSFTGRREMPAPMPLIAQQRREARWRVESRKAQPLHRSITTNESRGLHVTDQAVVLDTHRGPLHPHRVIAGVDVERRPGDVLSLVREQVGGRSTHVLGGNGPVKRRAL